MMFSLKGFHLFFIATALALLAFTLWWSAGRVLGGEDSGMLAMAAASCAGLVVGLPYFGWFLQKSRTLR